MAKHNLRAAHVILHDVLQFWEPIGIHDVKVDELVLSHTELRCPSQLENLPLALKLQIMVDFPKFLFKDHVVFKLEKNYLGGGLSQEDVVFLVEDKLP